MSVRVVARIRPRTSSERSSSSSSSLVGGSAALVVEKGERRVFVRNELISTRALCYEFDRVFNEGSSQEEVFAETADDLVRSTLEGFNASIFAYGPSGTGKTHTMLGTDLWKQATSDSISIAKRNGLSDSRGIIPRSMEAIFKEANSGSGQTKFKCSYFEIYNEKIFDLLNYEASKASKGGLDIREDKKSSGTLGIYVVDALQVEVASLDEVFELLWRGARNRAVSETEVNEHSSRSHTIFQVLIEQYAQGKLLKRAKLNLVDLAGSEKWRSHQLGEFSEKRIQEMTSINQSLSNLGNCVRGLLQPNRSHIPFRNSKLTRLLQDSLGGNCKTCFVVTASPSELAVEETMSTFQFANRVKQLAVHAVVNEEGEEASASYVRKLEAEIKSLKGEIASFKERSPSVSSSGESESVSSSATNTQVPLKIVAEKPAEKMSTEASAMASMEKKPEPTKSGIDISSSCDMGIKIAESLPLLHQNETTKSINERRKKAMELYHAWLLQSESLESSKSGTSKAKVSLEDRISMMEWSVYFQRDELVRMKRLYQAEIDALKIALETRDAEVKLLKMELQGGFGGDFLSSEQQQQQQRQQQYSTSSLSNQDFVPATESSEFASNSSNDIKVQRLPSPRIPVSKPKSEFQESSSVQFSKRPVLELVSSLPITTESTRVPEFQKKLISRIDSPALRSSTPTLVKSTEHLSSYSGGNSRSSPLVVLEKEDVEPKERQEHRNYGTPSVSSSSTPWRSYVDKNTGNVYYYNKITKETTWTKPAEGFLEAPSTSNNTNSRKSLTTENNRHVEQQENHHQQFQQAPPQATKKSAVSFDVEQIAGKASLAFDPTQKYPRRREESKAGQREFGV